jgi:D-lactate dehydrogenase (cytochrome)
MKKLIKPYSPGTNLITDESLFSDYATSYSNPKDEEEVSQIVKECIANNEKITVCGALTGLTGAGVPSCCHSMSTKNIKNIQYNKDDGTLTVGSGVTFEEIEKTIMLKSNNKREFPISPTEKTATIGGAIAMNSKGLRSYKYGPISNFIESITYCNAEGNIETTTKGDSNFKDFIGSEGMIGIFTGAIIRTIEKFKSNWGIMFFFPTDRDAASFADFASTLKEIQVIEYLDRNSFKLCDKYKDSISSIKGIPTIPEGYSSAIYVEIYGNEESEVEEVAEFLMENSIKNRSNPDLAWAMSDNDVKKLQNFRHSVSECFNMEVKIYNSNETRIKLVNIDIQWNNMTREDIIENYKRTLKDLNLEFIIFGHIGTYAPYVDILTKNINEYNLAKKTTMEIYEKAIKGGHTILQEFGIGKLKRKLNTNIGSIDSLNNKIKIQQKYDPNNIFNPNNIF